MDNKERHFCFVYHGDTMHFPDFRLLNIHAAEGFSHDIDGMTVQYVRLSLDPKNGKRAGAMPRVIDAYNKMDGRSEMVKPIIHFPSLGKSPIICFKKATPIDGNPILLRIEHARKTVDQRYWKWTHEAGATTTTSSSTSTTTRSRMTTDGSNVIILQQQQNQRFHKTPSSQTTTTATTRWTILLLYSLSLLYYYYYIASAIMMMPRKKGRRREGCM